VFLCQIPLCDTYACVCAPSRRPADCVQSEGSPPLCFINITCLSHRTYVNQLQISKTSAFCGCPSRYFQCCPYLPVSLFAWNGGIFDDVDFLSAVSTHCTTLQHIATHCNTLQHTVPHCSHCNTLQHTVKVPVSPVVVVTVVATGEAAFDIGYLGRSCNWDDGRGRCGGCIHFWSDIFIGKAVFICLVGSVNLVLKFQGMFFSAGWTPQNYST